MFERARIKLTAWYLVVIMAISIVFSLAIYSRVNTEFGRFERFQVRLREDVREGIVPPNIIPRNPRLGRIDPSEIQATRTRFIIILISLNLGIFVFAGAAGYFLAGETLKPIKEMIDEQNRFIADSSHELRTPLTSLRSEIEVGLRNKKITIAEARRILKSNLEEVINLQALSDSLLALSKNGHFAEQKYMEEVSLLSCVNEAIRRVEHFARERQTIIKNNVKGLTVRGVRERLTEVFVILLDNAIKYSPEKSKVQIVSKKDSSNIEITVSNKGKGIEEKDLPHIFDRFYRGSESRSKTDNSGYGLGLSIAKKIIESHGGSIFAKNTPKKETKFTVVLPLASPKEA